MSKLLQKRSIKSVWAILLLFMVICCSGVLTTWIVAKRTAKSALDAKLKELQSNGVPIDDESMTAYHHSLSSDENAAQWARILDTFGSKNFAADSAGVPILSETPPIPPLDQPWNEQQLVEQLLSKHADTIRDLVSLTQNNGPIRSSIDFDFLFNYLQALRAAVRVLKLEAHVAARLGDSQREFEAVNAILGCAASLHAHPFVVSQLVSVALHNLAIHQLQNSVQLDRLRPEHYVQLRNRLARFRDIRKPYEAAVYGERVFMLNSMREHSNLREYFGALTPVMLETGFVDRTCLKYSAYLERALEANVDNLKELGPYLRELNLGNSKFTFESLIPNPISDSLESLSTAYSRQKMSNDLAILAIALRQYEQVHGKLPESLTELESQGIDFEKFLAVDGSLPRYQLLDSASQTGNNCRAVLWSFDCPVEKATSPIPPSVIDSQAIDESLQWWHWDLK